MAAFQRLTACFMTEEGPGLDRTAVRYQPNPRQQTAA